MNPLSLTLLLLILSFSFCNAQTKTIPYEAVDSLIFACFQKGDFNKAVSILETVSEQRKAEVGELDTLYVGYINDLAFFYFRSGASYKSKSTYEKNLFLTEKVFGAKSERYGRALNNYAGVLENFGEDDLAEKYHLESLNLTKELLGKEHKDYAESLNNFSQLLSKNNRYEEALRMMLEVRSIHEKIPTEPRIMAKCLNNLALLYVSIGNESEAEALFKEAIAFAKKSFGEVHPAVAFTTNNLGKYYLRINEVEKASPLLLESMKVHRQALGEQHPNYASSLCAVARLHRMKGQSDLFESMYHEAIAIYEKQLGARNYLTNNATNELVAFYLDENRLIEAKQLLMKAISNNVGYQVGAEVTKEWADSLKEAQFGSITNMDISLKQLLEYCTKDSLQDNRSTQLIIAQLALELLNQHRDMLENEEDKLRGLESSHLWTLVGLKAIDKEGEVAVAFDLAEQSKSILLMEAVQAQQAYSFGDLPDSLLRKEKAFQSKKADLNAQLAEKRSEEEQVQILAELNDTNKELIAFKTSIQKDYPNYVQLKYQNQSVRLQEVQNLLPQEAALIEYVVGKDKVYTFCITNKTQKILATAIEDSLLHDNIRMLHESLSNYAQLIANQNKANEKYTQAASWIYKQLVQPIVEGLSKDISHLIFITDGELGHIPFEVLLKDIESQSEVAYATLPYLINDYTISYDYSATLWKENISRGQRTSNGRMMALAAAYETPIDESNFTKNRLPAYQRMRKSLKALPAAEEEVKVLSNLFDGVFALDGSATERFFKENAQDYGIIHLAMHGLLDKEEPILSSLAFTEDNDSIENNFLQAYEISKMKLNANLVVLSACETGYGKFEKGNGIASLARSFMFAGASSLVVSLWQVNDLSTSIIMQTFYKNINEGMDKAVALQQAKLYYLENAQGVAAHPAFWSPFILIGDTGSIKIGGKQNYGLYLGLLAFLLLGAGGIWYRKRNQAA